MNLDAFKSTLDLAAPPENLSVYLCALWYDGKNNWNEAHRLADSREDKTAYRVHAYLHRKEGDFANAGYWYRRAGATMPGCSLQQEWEEIAEGLLHHIGEEGK